MDKILFYAVPAMGALGLLYTLIKFNWVSKQDAGTDRMKQISNYIAEGAMAFLKAEYKILGYFVVIVALLLGFMGYSDPHSHWSIALAFVMGAFFSAFAGFVGMKIATKANVRTAQAARTSLRKALQVSFTGGSVMGMGVAGLAVLGLGGLFIILKAIFAPEAAVDSEEMKRTIEVLTGFSLGAESIALFARVGGGIYTKAADVGADLVGKVEAGIPEDDPRNPATIADNVGDNVGDVAGMGADLFGSYVATVLATMVLGREVTGAGGVVLEDGFGGLSPILLPMLIAGIGILFSIVGTWFVRISDNAGISTQKVQAALNMGNWGSIILTAIVSYFLVSFLLPEHMLLRGFDFTPNKVFGAIMVGLAVGTLMSMITEYYTAMGKRPVMSIIRQSSTGHATNIIGGLAIGMESTLLPILVLAGGIYGSYYCAGLYGVAIAAAGMMATTAMQLAIDAFGPIADNAGGIAEMSELPKEVREKTDVLDAVGNTTAATGKGFAIASAALTALALFAAFVGIAGIKGIDIYHADVLAGLFVGGMIPFIFSSLAIRAVGEAAMSMVEEVRRQFHTIPGIMEGTGKPEYDKCVAISTEASLKKMMLPGAIAILTPIVIGFVFGPEVLGGFLAGATVSGVLMGMFQNNAGGAWDNAKKSFETGVEINGQMFYKKSEPHKASVTGDTVGDPFKDTSGPSMNILIKLMSIVSLVIAPTLAQLHTSDAKPAQVVEQKMEVKVIGNDSATTEVTVNASEDGFKSLVEALKKDGLATDGKLSIVYQDGKFSINGKEQSAEVLKKYESYFNGKKSIHITLDESVEKK
ncbi:MAG: sodium-translocating pyrophosphatase [Chitinophagaceae bacterium]|nr:sodium-translocating pyrophosphatase [Chitinophagaceae bacterium]MCA6453625.1 sodium-translocating pyrophosphatase [Chitinophagaceae bacterium]MCA6458616.1 sodium-translocating pyrophosphatase [Chitinophagaceae bacterium]MCA6464968.1 sodium-translocating pyrophosphatase [Chitinophagaceae bacterium]MEA3425694.1 sodium-translocating pyrophosphatase [Bacteroidota bacterium]